MDDLLLVHEGWYETVYRPAMEKYLGWNEEQIVAAFGGMKIPAPEPIMAMKDGNAHISIQGPLSNKGPNILEMLLGFSGTSYRDIQSAVAEADSKLASNGSIFLEMDTPGGGVSGAKDTFDAIAAVSSHRNVVAVNRGMIASAGMWLASAANQILAVNPMAMAGSIGIMSRVRKDESSVAIVNTDSPDKAPDAMSDAGKAVMVSLMDDIYGIFVSDILSGRGNKTSESAIKGTKGRLLVADKAIAIGLMDGFYGKTELDGADNSNIIGNGTSENNSADADARENVKMDEKMKAEIAEMITAAVSSLKPAAQAEKNVSAEVVAAVRPFLVGGEYPEAVKAIALACLTGEAKIETLKAEAAAFDAKNELEKSEAAKKASELAGQTNSGDPAAMSPDGVIENEAQFQSHMEQYK